AASFTARSRRLKFLAEYQEWTISSLSNLSRPAASVKKPRAWLDQENTGIFRRLSQAFHSSSEADTQPAQTGFTISASAKLLLSALGAISLFLLAYLIAASMRARLQLEPPKASLMRPAFTSRFSASTNSPTG